MSFRVQRSTSSSIYQTASKFPAEVSDAPAGAAGIFQIFWQWSDTLQPGPDHKEFVQMLFSSLHLSFCGIIPARFIWSWSFISAQTAAWTGDFFLHSARWMCCCSYSIFLSAFIYQDVAEQVELWLNCLSFSFFFWGLQSTSRAYWTGPMHYSDLC